jgi:hypothetical protein
MEVTATWRRACWQLTWLDATLAAYLDDDVAAHVDDNVAAYMDDDRFSSEPQPI